MLSESSDRIKGKASAIPTQPVAKYIHVAGALVTPEFTSLVISIIVTIQISISVNQDHACGLLSKQIGVKVPAINR